MSLYEVSYNWVNITDEFTNNVKGMYSFMPLVEDQFINKCLMYMCELMHV